MYDLVILGAGPAGYVAAERAAAMGGKVLLIEKDKLGGVCLNCGCIPTKSFLHSAKLYEHAVHGAVFGVAAKGVQFDYDVMKKRTQKVQETLVGGIGSMMKRHKVDVVSGSGVVVDKNSIKVGDQVYQGKHLLLATGSRPAHPPIPGLADNPAVVDSTGMLAMPKLVDHLAVIGGGVIGIEFATFYAMLGKKVTVVEMLPQICGAADRDVANVLHKKLESRGAAVHVNAKVGKVEGSTVHFTDKDGKDHQVKADLILSATGRKPNTDGMGYESLNLAMDRNYIQVNDRAQTSVANVYAAGDLTGHAQLAHFASRQAIVAVHNIFGRPDVCREEAVPGVIYGDPEIASVGLTETQVKAKGLEFRAIKMPLAASGRYMAETDGDRGFVKAVLGDRGQLLGMHVVGSYASEMIGAAAVMIETELRAQDIQEIIFPHPTVAEIMKEVMFLY